MKRIISKIQAFIFVFLVITFVSSCNNNKVLEKADKIADEIRAECCADKRISLFDVKAHISGKNLILKGETLSIEAKDAYLNRLQSELHAQLIDSIVVLPHPSLGDEIYGVICVSVAQLRRNPDVDQEIVNQAIMGEEVKILKKNGFWYYCQLDDKYLGWMMRSSVETGDSVFVEKWRSGEKMIVSANYGQVWNAPRKEVYSVCDVVRENKLKKVGYRNGWYEVELPDGRKGFIEPNSVRSEKDQEKLTDPKPEDLVELAYQFLGIPYFWGGRSTKGFDCSGFTQTVYKVNNILLPRDANMQVMVGEEIDFEENMGNIKTGDLLFFGRSVDRITHVGMYIGNSKFIHSDGYVHINSFNPEDKEYSEYRRKGLQAVRRIIDID